MTTPTAPQTLELTIDRPVAGGRMLARHDGRVVFVAGGVPGERVRARVERVKAQITWATVTEIVEASPDRREPACDVACGGAAYAYIRYDRQLQLKADIIGDAFRRIGKITLPTAVAVAPSPEAGYRLRARLHVRSRRAGFFREGSHALCEAGPTGQLLPETMMAVQAALGVLDERLQECDELVVAENIAATERVLHVVPFDGARLIDLAGKLPLPDGVTGLTTASRGSVVRLAGAGSVHDTADELFGGVSPIPPATWRRQAVSFFQGNRHLIGLLVRRVLDLANGDRFIDLYAGVGLFAVALAARGQRGLAVEVDANAVADLAENAAPWADGLKVLAEPVESVVRMPLDPAPDVVVVDPPRTGLSPEAAAGLLRWSPRRIVYVSCDPPTLARDANRLTSAGYRLDSLDAFDLFPNTPHVEVLAAFERA